MVCCFVDISVDGYCILTNGTTQSKNLKHHTFCMICQSIRDMQMQTQETDTTHFNSRQGKWWTAEV
jgi:hypothetical protein